LVLLLEAAIVLLEFFLSLVGVADVLVHVSFKFAVFLVVMIFKFKAAVLHLPLHRFNQVEVIAFSLAQLPDSLSFLVQNQLGLLDFVLQPVYQSLTILILLSICFVFFHFLYEQFDDFFDVDNFQLVEKGGIFIHQLWIGPQRIRTFVIRFCLVWFFLKVLLLQIGVPIEGILFEVVAELVVGIMREMAVRVPLLGSFLVGIVLMLQQITLRVVLQISVASIPLVLHKINNSTDIQTHINNQTSPPSLQFLHNQPTLLPTVAIFGLPLGDFNIFDELLNDGLKLLVLIF
jgi:hypothetical protein